MQVARLWTPPAGPLGRLSSASAERAAQSRAAKPYADQVAEALSCPPAADILAALSARPDVAVIAELKRSSPSKGAINVSLDAAAQARDRFDLAPSRLTTAGGEPAGAFAVVEVVSLP